MSEHVQLSPRGARPARPDPRSTPRPNPRSDLGPDLAPEPDLDVDPDLGPEDMVAAYERCFRSRAYDEGYPRATPSVVSRIRSALPPGGHVIDYGCESGRYLFALRGQAGLAAGVDVSPAVLNLLATRARAAEWSDLAVLGPDPCAVEAHGAAQGPADLVLCLFGEPGPMPTREARRTALRRMGRLLRPGSGRLVRSVPNRWRRFYAEQWRAGPGGTIRYTRSLRDRSLQLHYHLYGPMRLCRELAAAGLRLKARCAESLFGESVLARNGVARRVDRILTPLLPAAAGYGLLAIAAPAGESAA